MENDKEKSPLFRRTVAVVRKIPKGKVATYGQIATFIGAHGCARHVSYILSSSSKKYDLPWQRVVGSGGKVPVYRHSARQRTLLKTEGLSWEGGALDLDRYGWQPTKKQLRNWLKGIPQHISFYMR